LGLPVFAADGAASGTNMRSFMLSRVSRSTSANSVVAAVDSGLSSAYPAEADLGALVVARAQAALLDGQNHLVSRVASKDRSAAPVWSAQAWLDDPAPADSYQADRYPADLYPAYLYQVDQYQVDQYQVDRYQVDRFPVDQDFPVLPVAGLADSASVWEYQVLTADSDPADPYQDGSAFRVLPAESTVGPAGCPEVCNLADSPVRKVADCIPAHRPASEGDNLADDNPSCRDSPGDSTKRSVADGTRVGAGDKGSTILPNIRGCSTRGAIPSSIPIRPSPKAGCRSAAPLPRFPIQM
jgi:hypothetical protein